MTGWARWQDNEPAGHTDSKDRQKMSLVSAHVLVFYAVQNPSLWNGTTHIEDGSSHADLSGNTTQRDPKSPRVIVNLKVDSRLPLTITIFYLNFL